MGPGGELVGPGGQLGVAGRVGGWGGGPGGMAGRVGWYGPAAVNVYTARKGVSNGGVKNALRARYNRVGSENLGGCRDGSGREKMIWGIIIAVEIRICSCFSEQNCDGQDCNYRDLKILLAFTPFTFHCYMYWKISS